MTGTLMAPVEAFEITARRERAEGVVEIVLAHPGGGWPPDWAPGAHIDLVLPNGLIRQYSLCGDRWDARVYRIAVLREPRGRGGSAYAHDELRVGDRVGVGGPRNNFPLVPADGYLFVAGGIGITPILPMIQQADLLGADWKLLYGGRRRGSMAFLEELAAYGDRVRLVPEDELGLPDVTAWLARPRPGTRVYCCGPAPLLAAVERACRPWPPYTLHVERFSAKEQGAPARDTPFDVELRRSGRTVTVGPGTSVLQAVRAAGVEVLSSCRQGTCGTCETTVLDGVPDHRDSILADREEEAADCMFICVSRSCTDRLVLDL
ncbi:PDR/VanB family oxidoreductase [Nonomuraea sp. NPDC050451]|uniref:PDR/VanB family oxidoreductase n=1 Tax=Nonomuraea sp. NPDC050451 TaxID=3364364 RepID=UPI003791C7BE